jgi:hypothetical protein
MRYVNFFVAERRNDGRQAIHGLQNVSLLHGVAERRLIAACTSPRLSLRDAKIPDIFPRALKRPATLIRSLRDQSITAPITFSI